MAYSIHICFFYNFHIKSIKVANPIFDTLETGNMGHMFPEGIN
jgi:hypothetical protein